MVPENGPTWHVAHIPRFQSSIKNTKYSPNLLKFTILMQLRLVLTMKCWKTDSKFEIPKKKQSKKGRSWSDR